jgi:predicted Zn-dependent protease
MQTQVDQVLMFLNPKVSEELGPALWAALQEVEAFYNFAEQRAVFRRIYLSEVVPEGLILGYGGLSGFSRVWNWLFGGDAPEENASASRTEIVQHTLEGEWQEARGKYARTYDARRIAGTMRRLLPKEGSGTAMVIVTDQELAPPPDWRYVIMDGDIDQGIVISTLPTDPRYWQISDPDRVALVKHRIRACCLQIVGRILGLEYCDNERCFLFHPVDSVRNLDHMVELGCEHKIEALAQRGYRIRVNNPSVVQSIEKKLELEAETY